MVEPSSSATVFNTEPTGRVSKYFLFHSIKKSVLEVCSSMLSEYYKLYVKLCIKMDLSRHNGPPQVNDISLQVGLRVVLEGKLHRALDLSFIYVFAYADTLICFS